MVIAWVYILTNVNNNVLYVGSTPDLKKRIWEHRMKQDPKCFTAKYNVYKLIYFEEFNLIGEARLRETFIKKKKRSWKFELINSLNPALVELDPELPRSAQLY